VCECRETVYLQAGPRPSMVTYYSQDPRSAEAKTTVLSIFTGSLETRPAVETFMAQCPNNWRRTLPNRAGWRPAMRPRSFTRCNAWRWTVAGPEAVAAVQTLVPVVLIVVRWRGPVERRIIIMHVWMGQLGNNFNFTFLSFFFTLASPFLTQTSHIDSHAH
jgi:hypothetical protein